MNKKTLTLAVTVTVLVGAVGFGVYRLGMARGMATHSAAITAAAPVAAATPPTATQALPKNVAEGEAATRRHITTGVKAGDIDPANGGKVLYYQDPMLPGNKFDKPAKSPFMDISITYCTVVSTRLCSCGDRKKSKPGLILFLLAGSSAARTLRDLWSSTIKTT